MDGNYPRNWSEQILLPIEKKGHTVSSPQLRGIAISSLLPRIYDAIIDNRFKSFYTPNKEQSGFRKSQGCILQLFYVILLLQWADKIKTNLYLLLVDYEKAFDFANRAVLIDDIMQKGLGKKFVKAVADMYNESSYIPKINSNMLGHPIRTSYGVTQGRRSSTSFFSFLLHEMAPYIQHWSFIDFMDPHFLAQMADDTILAAESVQSLASKFERLCNFSHQKLQSINMIKTMYVHMSKAPNTKTISCNNGVCIKSLEAGESTCYLGMYLLHTNSLQKIIELNLSKRMFNVAKYKSWLDVNENTPFTVKLVALDNCVLSAVLYGCEV